MTNHQLDELADLRNQCEKLKAENDLMKPYYIDCLKNGVSHHPENLQKLIDLGIDVLNDQDIIDTANQVILGMGWQIFDFSDDKKLSFDENPFLKQLLDSGYSLTRPTFIGSGIKTSNERSLPPISPILEYVLRQIENFDITINGNESLRRLRATLKMLEISSKYLDFSTMYGSEGTFFDICVKKINYEKLRKGDRFYSKYNQFVKNCEVLLAFLDKLCHGVQSSNK